MVVKDLNKLSNAVPPSCSLIFSLTTVLLCRLSMA